MTNALFSEQPARLTPKAPANSLETFVVASTVVIIGLRIQLPFLLTVGDVLALMFLPIWIKYLRVYVTTGVFIALGALAICSGAVLTLLSSTDHVIDTRVALTNNFLLLGLLASLGFLLWAKERLGTSTVIILFGLGALVGVNRSTALFAQSPWKFGYATGATILVLGLSQLSKKRWLDLVLVLALVVLSAITDSRSVFAILLLIAALIAWQARPLVSSRTSSAVRGLLGLGVFAALIYNLGQILIINGALGVRTKLRSIQQINETGSLLLGGRPEIAATIAMMRDHIFGYGSGTRPNYHDILVAKEGMAAINYDPNNGYVENYMFGASYELHSVAGDFWARFGIIGLIGAIFAFIIIAGWLGRAVTAFKASAVMLFLTISSLWNIAFSPLYAAISVLTLTLAVIAGRREGGEGLDVLTPSRS